MRAEGDIANLITSVAIWRRIGIIGEETSGVVLMGLTTTGNGLPGPSQTVARASIRSRSPWPLHSRSWEQSSSPEQES
jgi:hypothetical protein